MYVTGRWVSENVVSTMFIAWILGVIVFAVIVCWQRRKHRKSRSDGHRGRGTLRSTASRKSRRSKR